jgi:hypothetical protein
MSRLIQVSVGPLAAAAANNIGLSQTLGAAGNVTLNGALVVGGVAVLDQPRRIIVTSSGNDSGITFTAYGTDWSGNTIQSVATAGGNTAAVDLGVSFATVTRIDASGATAATITVGTNGVADSRPVFLDPFGFGPTLIHAIVSGTVNYTVKYSQDDPNGVGGYGVPLYIQNASWFNDASLANTAISGQVSLTTAPYMVQVTMNSGTGSVRATITQYASPS